jgi:hypothetical protein
MKIHESLRTATYYPVAGAMPIPHFDGPNGAPASPKSDDENVESAFRFNLVVFALTGCCARGVSIASPDGRSLEGVGGA